MLNQKARKKIRSKNPRLVVARSNRFIYAQIVDDTKGVTLQSASDLKMGSKSKIERAKEVGVNLAKLAAKKNIKKVIFDRAGYKYHGRIKAVAEGARTGGLEF
ncbi:50S ribosomal protein L18 [Candidatus Curtissbacteria bacterium]|nr:50S ribosomal protein L18 [Candidatus Curtissbacteria bacterium]